MKIWQFTLRSSSGANNTLRRSLSLQSFPSDNFWQNETMQLKPWDRHRGSTKNNIGTLTFDVCLFPASSSVSPWSPSTSYSRSSPGFPDSPRPYPQTIFLQGHMEVDRNGKWVPAEPTTDTVSAWDEVISACRITVFSDIPWNSNTWLPIGGDYQTLNTS